jgi:DNA-binding IclR family transcriptional regulator
MQQGLDPAGRNMDKVPPVGCTTIRWPKSNWMESDRMLKTETTATSLDRALTILEMAARKPDGLSNSDFHRQLDIPRSSCSYILGRLEKAGYLRRSAYGKRYGLGLKILTLAHGALRELGLRGIAEPILHELTQQTGYSGVIGVLQHGKVMIVDKVDRPGLGDIDFELGATIPAHATALGKMLLASLGPDQLETFLSTYPLIKRSKKTVDSRGELLQDLALIRRRGYATSDGELFVDVCAIAAPIRDAGGVVCAGLTLAGVGVPLDEPDLVRAVKGAAAQISRRLAKATLTRQSFNDDAHALSCIAHV